MNHFKDLDGSADAEAYERYLIKQDKRDDFYELLTAYTKSLDIALGTASFYDETPKNKIDQYKRDLHRFINLRKAVKLRYAEVVNFKDYDGKIRKMLNNHIGANEIEITIPEVNIFNINNIDEVTQQMKNDRARADLIASNMKRVLTENVEKNPALYKKLSEMLGEVIQGIMDERYDEVEYLRRVKEIHKEMLNEGIDKVPENLRSNPNAAAFYGYLTNSNRLKKSGVDKQVLIEFTESISSIFKDYETIPKLFERTDYLKEIKLKIDNLMYDTLQEEHGLELQSSFMDEIQDNIMSIARARMS